MSKNTITLTDEQLKAFNNGEDVVLKAPQRQLTLFEPTDGYYFVTGRGNVNGVRLPFLRPQRKDIEHWDFFNCYPSRVVAAKAAARMRRANAIISACLAVDPDFRPEDHPPGRPKWRVGRDQGTGKWRASSHYGTPHGIDVLSSGEKAQQAADILNSLDLPN